MMKKPDIRHLYDMKEVLYDKKWAESAPNLELYYMRRGVEKKGGLRRDITVVPGRLIGREFTKTKGHEHSNNYGEIYSVLKGEAIYLLQKYQKNEISDVFAVKAKKGQAVIVPPGYGHITINPSKKELVEANWLAEKCRNVYDLFVKKEGACYYYTKAGWLKNKKYGKIPKLAFKKPLNEMPENLDFLK